VEPIIARYLGTLFLHEVSGIPFRCFLINFLNFIPSVSQLFGSLMPPFNANPEQYSCSRDTLDGIGVIA